MFSSILRFAHAGETHSDVLETAAHFVAPWYLAVPAFLIALAIIGYLTWLISGKKIDVVMIVLAIACLISGFTLFNVSAAVSVIAITGGLMLAMFLTLGSLISPKK